MLINVCTHIIYYSTTPSDSKMIAKNRRPSGKYERADSARLQATEGRGFSRKLPQWDMCDPTGRNGHTTAAAFVKIESAVRDLAEIYGKVYVTLAESDKCKLTVLNGAQGRDEGGEACLQAHRMHIPRVVSALNTGEGATSWLLGQEHSDRKSVV